MTLERRLMAEWLGTFSLLATVIGSGIMAERLADGNVAIALLGNTIPTGAILVVLITIFGPISGAHFNPAVTLSFAMRREITKRDSLLYVTVQVFGGIAGVLAAHVMFEHALLDPSTTSRSGIGQWTGEFVATFGLVGTILACIQVRPPRHNTTPRTAHTLVLQQGFSPFLNTPHAPPPVGTTLADLRARAHASAPHCLTSLSECKIPAC